MYVQTKLMLIHLQDFVRIHLHVLLITGQILSLNCVLQTALQLRIHMLTMILTDVINNALITHMLITLLIGA
jgi:hypothetical protein